MMPTCPIKRCHKVAETKACEVIDLDEWKETVYLCNKHYIKLLKMLGRQTNV